MMESRRAQGLALIAFVVIVFGGLVIVRAVAEDYDIEVRDAAVPALASIDRKDAAGDATLTAFLQASLGCTQPGFALLDGLSGSGARKLDKLVRDTCAKRKEGGPFAGVLLANQLQESVQEDDTIRWAIQGDTQDLPLGTEVELRRENGLWVVG